MSLAERVTQDDRANFSLSASRALKILSLFNPDRLSLSVTEIGRALMLSKTSTLRFVQALEMHGYLERDPRTRRYHPGMEAVRVGNLYVGNSRIRRVAQPILEQLSADHGFTAYLSALQDDQVVILSSVEAQGRLKYSIPVGTKINVNSTATGRAALSVLAPDEVDALIARTGMPVRTSKTITSLPKFKAALQDTRARGYSVNWEEHTQGVRCVAAPVRKSDGSLLCVLSLGFANSQVTREQLAPLGEAIRNAASLMTRRMAEEEGEQEL